MSDQEKFAAFKDRLVQQNEAQYGQEARQKYGDAAVDRSQSALRGMTQEQFDAWNQLDAQLRRRLEQAVQAGLSPDSEEGKEICAMHRPWLQGTDPKLTPAKHKGIAELYVLDERFTAYYDRQQPGCARFLRDAVARWAE